MPAHKRLFIISFALAILMPGSMALRMPDKPAYLLFEQGKNKPVSYSRMLKQLLECDVVFFGELHNNPICHWLQLQLAKDLYEVHGKNLMFGAEMLEADNQLILDEYLDKVIREDQFLKEARLWNNYKTDYAPLVNFARERDLRFIATNVPRRYAGMVSRGGLAALDALSEAALGYCAPLPLEVDYDLPGYREMKEMMQGHGSMPGSPDYFVAAQALKDATMAHFIAVNLNSEGRLLHFNGSYHSNRGEGILHYLRKLKPGIRICAIATVEQSVLDSLDSEHRDLADFILVIPVDMTKTY